MDKKLAINLLGGSVSKAAAAIGISYHAVLKWPEKLPPRIEDRVYAALWKREHGEIRMTIPASVAVAK